MQKLSIIIPQYKTETLIRLCLRSIRKYSRGEVSVIVIDNGSSDGSTDYLRSLQWINLIENQSGVVGGKAHWEALQLGVKRADAGYLCFFHSDTIVLKAGWDTELMGMINRQGAVGLGTFIRDINKFERGPERWKRNLKESISDLKRGLKGRNGQKAMSSCFIVRKDVVEDSGFTFSGDKGDAVDALYKQVVAGKHPFLMLGRRELEPLLWHTSNATSIINGQITEKRLVEKYYSKTGVLMGSAEIQAILNDSSLDM